MAKRWPEFALALALIAATPLLLLIPINHDSYWTLWLARQMRYGVGLYSQLIEVNPPLWFWIAVPIELVAEAVHLPPIRALVLMFVAALGMSFWLTSQLAGEQRARLYVATFFVAVLMPLSSFTQREHFALITAIPYVLLAAKRSNHEDVPPWLAVAIGLLSAVGFALKPFFLLVPTTLALWSRSIRLEAWVVGIFVALYAVAILVFAPAYLSVVVPLVASAYAGFGGMTPATTIFGLLPFAFAAPLLGRAGPIVSAFLVASLSFYVALLAQGKGWGYQALPAHGLLIMALAFSSWGRSPWRDVLAAASLAVMAIPRAGLYRNPASDLLATRIREPAGSTVAILSYSTMPVWPLVEQKRYRWPLRFMSLWMLGAARKNPTLLAELNGAISNDLACNPPHILVVDDGADLKVLSHFHEVDRAGPYRIMIPNSDLGARENCRAIY